MSDNRNTPRDDANPLTSAEEATWEELYRTINPAGLLLLAEELIGDRLRPELAPEDVLNGALAHVWAERARLEWRGPRAFRALVIMNMRRRIVDQARRLDRGHANEPAAGAALAHHDEQDHAGEHEGPARAVRDVRPPISTTTTPSRVAWLREQAAAIRAALEAVPEEQRTVLRLRIIEQMTVVEIARALRRAPETVRALLVEGARTYAWRLRERLGSRVGEGAISP
ncbi:MAG: RNA polymerase sigma factor [Phycisphaerales bacterium]